MASSRVPMNKHRNRPIDQSRRETLKVLGGGAVAALTSVGRSANPRAQQPPIGPRIVLDGHVHIATRVHWEQINPWNPQVGWWNYAQAHAAGVNCAIDGLGTYGYWNYNQAPKHTLRLIETFHRIAEANTDKMDIALTAADARRIIASGRMAVFMGVESGWDHDGDIDVLRAMHRLGLRHIQFSSQTRFNALADVGVQSPHWNGLSPRGRTMIEDANSRRPMARVARFRRRVVSRFGIEPRTRRLRVPRGPSAEVRNFRFLRKPA
jgi:membrane dipeptidase